MEGISLLAGDAFFFEDTMSVMHVDDRVKLTSGPLPWFLFLIASQPISQNNMLYNAQTVVHAFSSKNEIYSVEIFFYVLAKPRDRSGGGGGGLSSEVQALMPGTEQDPRSQEGEGN